MITWLRRHAIIFLLLWSILAGSFLAARTSPTADEAIHTASAYLALTRGDFRFDPEHPFTFKYLTALPMLALQPNLPANDQRLWSISDATLYDSWIEARTWADSWLYESDNNAGLMMFLMRLPGVMVFALLIYLTWYLVREWFGERAAIWASFFVATNPTFLAHAATTNTDVPIVAALALGVLAAWRLYLEPRSVLRMMLLGLALTLIVTTKHSGVLFVPVFLGWAIYAVTRASAPHRARRVFGMLGIVLFTSWAALWASYGFHSQYIPISDITPASAGLQNVEDRLAQLGLPSLERVAIATQHIIPLDYTKGLLMVLGGGGAGRDMFIWGEWYTAGRWFFFPLSLLGKTQLAVLGLGIIAICTTYRRWAKPRDWHPASKLLVACAGIFLLSALTSKLNLGIRHISPVLWIACIALGAWFAQVSLQRRQLRSGLIIFTILGTLLPLQAQQQNLIGFSNLIVGLRGETFKTFIDSNLDWAQLSQETVRQASLCAEQRRENTVYMNQDVMGPGVNYYADQLRRSGKFAPVFQRFDPVNPPESGIIVLSANHLSWGMRDRNTTDRRYFDLYDEYQSRSDIVNVYEASFILGCDTSLIGR
jgi:hypothetical protein